MASTGIESSGSVEPDESERQPRRLRADAQRNVAALLEAAKNLPKRSPIWPASGSERSTGTFPAARSWLRR
jgi:hypothetical protein